MKKSSQIFSYSLFISLSIFSLSSVQASDTTDKSQATTTKATPATTSEAELDQLMAPIALYPDSLLAQILMATTYPSDVTEAIKWSKDNPKQEGDAAVKMVQEKKWDPSVMSLVAFPQVLDMMSKQPDWVKKTGDAFLADSEKLMDSVQKLRKKAQDEGNLKSSDEQKIVVEEKAAETIIIIEPTNPKVVYVPVYNTTVVYGTWWWPHYTPWYYYPPTYVYRPMMPVVGFAVGVGITYALWGNCRWGHGRGSVNINVNRYNNINVNRNKLNINNKNNNWNHDRNNRGNNLSRDNNKRAGAEQRKDFRGRDTQRDNARNTLNKRAVNPAEGRKQLKGAEGNKVRSSVGQTNKNFANKRQSNAASGSRSNNAFKGSKNSSNSRNNAFKGARNSSSSRRSTNRGNYSNRSSHSSHRSGGFSGGGRSGGGGRGRR